MLWSINVSPRFNSIKLLVKPCSFILIMNSEISQSGRRNILLNRLPKQSQTVKCHHFSFDTFGIQIYSQAQCAVWFAPFYVLDFTFFAFLAKSAPSERHITTYRNLLWIYAQECTFHIQTLRRKKREDFEKFYLAFIQGIHFGLKGCVKDIRYAQTQSVMVTCPVEWTWRSALDHIERSGLFQIR